MTPTRRRPHLALAFTIIALALTTGPAAADDTDSTDSTESQRLQLVLDASGSMKEPAAKGTKIQAARKALGHVVDTLPDQAQVGLRVYGAKVSTGPKACTDSQQVVAPGTDNRDQLRDAITAYRPLGETPIGYALQQAGKDLGSEGKRTIVLVSDGEPTCSPDPCKVAKKLSRDGIDLKIDVVGLSVDAKTRKKLRCIADAGHGSYFDADDAESLTERLTVTSTRAFRPFDFSGTPVTGSANPLDAPAIGVGQYLDQLPAKDGVTFYKIPRTVPGSTIHVGTTARTTVKGGGTGLLMTLSDDPNGVTECDRATSFDGISGGIRLLNASLNTWSSKPDDSCATVDFLVLSMKQSINNDLEGSPVEIVVFEEPPLAEGSEQSLPPADKAIEWEPMTPGKSTDEVVPGTSIASAPEIDPGSYTLDIRSGERQVFAIPLNWGERLQVQIDADLSEKTINAHSVNGGFEPNIISPTRGDETYNFGIHMPDDWSDLPLANMPNVDSWHWRKGAASHPVSYLNRSVVDQDMVASSLAGYRYIDVGYNIDNPDAVVEYDLTVKVLGQAGEGEPEYAEDGDAVAPDGDQAVAVDPPEPAKSGPTTDDDFPVVGATLTGVGALVLVGGIIATVLATRKRRQIS